MSDQNTTNKETGIKFNDFDFISLSKEPNEDQLEYIRVNYDFESLPAQEQFLCKMMANKLLTQELYKRVNTNPQSVEFIEEFFHPKWYEDYTRAFNKLCEFNGDAGELTAFELMVLGNAEIQARAFEDYAAKMRSQAAGTVMSEDGAVSE